MNPLFQLRDFGQSPWLDYIRRGLITSGGLKRLVDEYAVAGVTSNPTILNKAISGSTDYDDALRSLVESGERDPKAIFLHLAVEDIGMTADVLRPYHDETGGADGFASLEVSPNLARDTEGTIKEALSLFSKLSRPNAMIKVPGTPEGLPAIEELTKQGVNVNVTLLFDVKGYERTRRCGARWRSPTRSWPTSSSAGSSQARAGIGWPRRAGACSVCSGPPPERRTRAIRMSSTWRS